MRKHLLWAVCLIIAANLSLCGQQVGNAAPDFEVNLLSGEQFKLSDHLGKVVMVYLFGNTCPYCIGAGPTIESSLHQAFKDNPNFKAVGLDTWDGSSNISSVTGFKNSTGISFPLAIKAGFVSIQYSTDYDRLMVIDHNGVLVHKGIVAAANDINNTKSVIESSLASIPSDPCETAEISIDPVVNSPACTGGTDGSIDISVEGTNPAFTYLWSNGSTTEDQSNLSHGSYGLTVTDSEGCSVDQVIVMDDPAPLTIDETVYQPVCSIDSVGSIKIEISGGTAPYGIMWSNDEENDSISGLFEGCYTVEVSDAHNCSEQKNFCITVPDPIEVNLTKMDNVCFGDEAGSVSIMVNGGVPPYRKLLEGMEAQTTVGNLISGNYTITVYDAHNCVLSEEITINEPDEISLGEINGIMEVEPYQSYTYSVEESENKTFLWTVEGGTIISGQGTHIIEVQWGPNLEGKIEALAETASGCHSNTALLNVNIMSTTGKVDLAEEALLVYPNPVGEALYVSAENNVVVSIFDITGTLQLITKEKQIDLSNLARGSYIVEIKSQDHAKTVRIVKQ